MIKEIDPMDRYSYPVKETILGRLIYLEPRENPDKPGRSLRVIFDARFPLIEGFEPKYLYTVSFEKSGNQAGNHYHQIKTELFYPVIGNFEVHLENPKTEEYEIIDLQSDAHVALLIKTNIAHKVVSKTDRAVLLVVASAPNIKKDEFYFEL